MCPRFVGFDDDGEDDADLAAPPDDDDEGGGDGAGGGGGAVLALPPLPRQLDSPSAAAAGSGVAAAREKERAHYEAEIHRLQQAAQVRGRSIYPCLQAPASLPLPSLPLSLQATIGSLKGLLAQKSRTIADYQAKLEEARAMREAERAADGAARERLAADAFEENRGVIERLRGAVRDLHSAPAALAASSVNGQLMDRLDEMDAVLVERDRRIAEAEAELGALRVSLAEAQVRWLMGGEERRGAGWVIGGEKRAGWAG